MNSIWLAIINCLNSGWIITKLKLITNNFLDSISDNNWANFGFICINIKWKCRKNEIRTNKKVHMILHCVRQLFVIYSSSIDFRMSFASSKHCNRWKCICVTFPLKLIWCDMKRTSISPPHTIQQLVTL